MINVKFFGLLRTTLNTNELNISAENIKSLIDEIEVEASISCKRELKQAIIFVNEVNFLNLKKYRTKLQTGDKVVFLSPVSGG